MANITYDFAWVTKFKFDLLTAGESGNIPQLRNLLADVVSSWGGLVLGTVRAVDNLVHARIRLSDTVPPKAALDDIKGQLSFLMQEEYPELKAEYYGKYMWEKSFFRSTETPDDSVVDAWAAKIPQKTKP